jgi:hypothetical protein
MVENFSPVIFLYGMAIVLAVSKAFTMMIWRTLPKARTPLREEVLEAWTRRRPDNQAVKGADEAEEVTYPAVSSPAQMSATQLNTAPEK